MSGTPVSSSPVIAVTEPVPVANAPVVEVKPDSANDTIATQKAEEKPQTNEVFYMSTQEKGATLMSSMTNMCCRFPVLSARLESSAPSFCFLFRFICPLRERTC